MKLTKVIVLCYLLGLISLESASAQDLTVKLGANEIGLNQYFTISVALENDNIRQHTPFPDIDGFVKRGTSSSSSTSFINGKITSSHTITQNYQPTEKGKFVLKPFKMEVNSVEVSAAGLQIQFKPEEEAHLMIHLTMSLVGPMHLLNT
jgi:hypothetical protein